MGVFRLCDTHCHLDFSEFDTVRDTLLKSCVSLGVAAIVVPGISAQHWSRVLELCARETVPGSLLLKPALGLHPCFMAEHREQQLPQLEALLQQHRVVAVGEIGLDFWSADADVDAQTRLFTRQLALAKTYHLPVLLHVRKAHDQVLKQLRLKKFAGGGIVHAFSGSPQQAQQYVDLGFKLGVGGAVTYTRAQRLRRTLQQLGPESWVLETDAPDMPLAGRQGALNRPDYLPEIFAVLQEVFGCSAEPLAAQLWRNTEAVLGLLSVDLSVDLLVDLAVDSEG
ncbi:MAG: TatD DNase family protein [Motiliproteus sp.]|jgi:TatD DNase family protein